MLTLTGQATATKYTAAFETITDGKVWIHVITTIGTGSVKLQHSIAKDTTYTDFYPDGVLASFTVADSIKLYDLPGGLFWRLLNVGDTTATTCYVSGNVRVNVQDAEA